MTAVNGDGVTASRPEGASVEIDWGQYKVDALLVLVGGNPLPNAVAAQLLVEPGGAVYLLHTRRSVGVADRLKPWIERLEQRAVRVEYRSLGSETSEIVSAVTSLVKPLVGRRVGLHYTGGTKRMAVYAYEAVATTLAKASPQPWFSYLDARTLTMRLHRADVREAKDVAVEPAGLAVPLTLHELIQDLQGWTLPPFSPTALSPTPLLPGSAAALQQLHLGADGQNAWKGWLQREEACDPLTLPDDDDLLRPVAAELRRELDLVSGQQLPRDLLVQMLHLRNLYPHKSARDLNEEAFKWLQGKWLETTTLRAIRFRYGRERQTGRHSRRR